MSKSGVTFYFAEAKGDARDQPLRLRQRAHDNLSALAERYGGTAHVGYVCAPIGRTDLAYGKCALYDEMKPLGYEPFNWGHNIIAKLTIQDPHPADLSTLCLHLGSELNITLFTTVSHPNEVPALSLVPGEAK